MFPEKNYHTQDTQFNLRRGDMDTKTLYPTTKEIENDKQLMKKYNLTESSLMKHHSGQIYNNSIVKKTRAKTC